MKDEVVTLTVPGTALLNLQAARAALALIAPAPSLRAAQPPQLNAVVQHFFVKEALEYVDAAIKSTLRVCAMERQARLDSAAPSEPRALQSSPRSAN